MATEIEVKTNVDITSIKQLRQAIKEAKGELLQFDVGTDAFARAQQKVSKLTDKLGDLGDSAKIQGTGVERLSQSFSLLTQSLGSGDIDKAKLAFTGFGQALSAIPIFLLIEGIKLLYDNFDKIANIFSSTETQIRLNEKALKDLTNQVNINKVAIDSNIISLEAQLQLLKNQNSPLQDIVNKINEINGLKQDGFRDELKVTDKEINNLLEKQKALTTQLNLSDFLPDWLGGDATKKTSEEITQKITELSIKRGNVTNQVKSQEIKTSQEINEENKRAFEEEKNRNEERAKLDKEASEKRIANIQKILSDRAIVEEEFKQNSIKGDNQQAEIETENAKKIVDAEKLLKLEREKNIQDLKNLQLKSDLEEVQSNIDKWAKEDESGKKNLELSKQQEAVKLQALTVGINAAQGLSQAFFAFQLNGVKGNAKAELDVRKKMFEVDKAFNIARAIQDGIRSVQAALTIPPPAGQILAGANGALAAANVAKIAATKFDGGGVTSGSIGSISAPAFTAGSNSQPSNNSEAFNPSTFNPSGVSNSGNSNQSGQVNKVYVTETDIRNVSNKVAMIESRATFG